MWLIRPEAWRRRPPEQPAVDQGEAGEDRGHAEKWRGSKRFSEQPEPSRMALTGIRKVTSMTLVRPARRMIRKKMT